MDQLLEGKGAGLRLLQRAPSDPRAPVRLVRARLYAYDFTRLNTSWAARTPGVVVVGAGGDSGGLTQADGGRAPRAAPRSHWWTRTLLGEYTPAFGRANPSVASFLEGHGLPREYDDAPRRWPSLWAHAPTGIGEVGLALWALRALAAVVVRVDIVCSQGLALARETAAYERKVHAAA